MLNTHTCDKMGICLLFEELSTLVHSNWVTHHLIEFWHNSVRCQFKDQFHRKSDDNNRQQPPKLSATPVQFGCKLLIPWPSWVWQFSVAIMVLMVRRKSAPCWALAYYGGCLTGSGGVTRCVNTWGKIRKSFVVAFWGWSTLLACGCLILNWKLSELFVLLWSLQSIVKVLTPLPASV